MSFIGSLFDVDNKELTGICSEVPLSNLDVTSMGPRKKEADILSP